MLADGQVTDGANSNDSYMDPGFLSRIFLGSGSEGWSQFQRRGHEPEVSSENNPRIWQGRDGANSNEGYMNGFLPRIFLGSGKGGMEPIPTKGT